jgi:hypothetical protein
MAVQYSNGRVVTDGLILALDAGDRNSYPGSGTSWTDLSGNGNHGTLTNGPTFSSTNGGAINLDGVNDFILTQTLPYQLLVSGFSISITFYCLAQTNNDNILQWGSGAFNTANSNSFEMRIRNSGTTMESIVSCNTLPARNNFSPTTNFNNRNVTIDFTYNVGGNVILYENGIAKVSTDYSGIGTSTATNVLRIGKGTDTVMSGNVYNVKLYNRVLSATEVLQNYNALKSRFGLR